MDFWRALALTSSPGGLAARLDLLKQNFTLSMVGAATGVCFPIGLSYLLLYLGYGYGRSPVVSHSVEKKRMLRSTRPRRDLHYWSGAVSYLFG